MSDDGYGKLIPFQGYGKLIPFQVFICHQCKKAITPNHPMTGFSVIPYHPVCWAEHQHGERGLNIKFYDHTEILEFRVEKDKTEEA